MTGSMTTGSEMTAEAAMAVAELLRGHADTLGKGRERELHLGEPLDIHAAHMVVATTWIDQALRAEPDILPGQPSDIPGRLP